MTPLMMSALTSHTTLKHNYYYTTQHIHCDITDISKQLATNTNTNTNTDTNTGTDTYTDTDTNTNTNTCNFDAGSLSIGWSAVRWRPVQLSRLPPLLRPDYSDYGQQGSVVRSK